MQTSPLQQLCQTCIPVFKTLKPGCLSRKCVGWLANGSLTRKHPQNSHFITSNNKQQPFYGPLSGTTRVSRYQKKHSPTHHPDHHPIYISFFPSTTIHSIVLVCCLNVKEILQQMITDIFHLKSSQSRMLYGFSITTSTTMSSHAALLRRLHYQQNHTRQTQTDALNCADHQADTRTWNSATYCSK